jgi:hypothetical protein
VGIWPRAKFGGFIMTLLQKIQGSSIDIFLILYWLNLLLDFPLQGEFLAMNKSKNTYILFVHSMIWGMGITLGMVVLNVIYSWWQCTSLIFGHMLIDAWKCRRWYKVFNISDNSAFYIDQLLHVAQIIVCMVL